VSGFENKWTAPFPESFSQGLIQLIELDGLNSVSFVRQSHSRYSLQNNSIPGLFRGLHLSWQNSHPSKGIEDRKVGQE